MRLQQQIFLLYEELTYAMNAGNIGRVEMCFLPWAYIFQACGKHKYASALWEYLRDVHFRLPKRLARAIHFHILINPTGKPHKFRGVDWWVEWNNLFLKRIYGGKFSNHTKHNILKESPLIGVFRNVRIQVQKMFRMTKSTTRHSSPKMAWTLQKLAVRYSELQKNVFVKGHTTLYSIPDKLSEGIYLAQTTDQGNTVVIDDGDDMWVDLDELFLPAELGKAEEIADLEVDDNNFGIE
ncbi:hypothetical protein PM082_015651 [Marasmius tenuissimus]|nr:hypothetical protein PM082_015651 [Marasmius tenuissimus]